MNAKYVLAGVLLWSVLAGWIHLASRGAETGGPAPTGGAIAATRPAADTVTIAALPFADVSGEPGHGPMADAMGDVLMAHLSGVDGLRFVERDALDKVLAEHKLAGVLRPADQARLGKMVGAQFILTGSVTAVGDDLQITAHLLEVSSARVARSAKVRTRVDRIVTPSRRLAEELLGDLAGPLPELTAEQIDRSPQANLHFMRGLGYHFARMHAHAVSEMLKTLAIDSGHARARFWLGMAFFEQARPAHAKIEFGRFCKEFADHPLAPRARALLAKCRTGPSNPGGGGAG